MMVYLLVQAIALIVAFMIMPKWWRKPPATLLIRNWTWLGFFLAVFFPGLLIGAVGFTAIGRGAIYIYKNLNRPMFRR